MKKGKIYATGNDNFGDGNVSYYVFEKDKYFFDWLNEALSKISESKPVSNPKFVFRENEENEEVFEKVIEKMIDVHEKYSGKDFRIDIFYGNKRIYFTLKGSKNIRRDLASFVSKSRDWISSPQIKNEPSYLKKYRHKSKVTSKKS